MSKVLRVIFLVGLVLAVALVAGCSSYRAPSGGGGQSGGGTSGGTSGGTTVTEQNFAFSPQTLQVKVGDTVTFKNDDSTAHHVVFQAGNDLGEQQPGQSVTYKAVARGSFPYKCSIHPSMTGTIVVK